MNLTNSQTSYVNTDKKSYSSSPLIESSKPGQLSVLAEVSVTPGLLSSDWKGDTSEDVGVLLMFPFLTRVVVTWVCSPCENSWSTFWHTCYTLAKIF